MPRGRGGFLGNFDFYETGAEDIAYPDDETAISDACDQMFSMCGNAGQESLIGECLGDFEQWALEALENEVENPNIEDFMLMVLEWYQGRLDKLYATDGIWQSGFAAMRQQSNYHDSTDEYGEGTGVKF